MKHGLAHADIFFHRKQNIRMPALFETDVRVIGSLQMQRETDKVKQKTNSDLGSQKSPPLHEKGAVYIVTRVTNSSGSQGMALQF